LSELPTFSTLPLGSAKQLHENYDTDNHRRHRRHLFVEKQETKSANVTAGGEHNKQG